MSIYKTGGASTLDIVDRVKKMLDYNKGSLPEGLHISTFFDQSLYVRASSKASSARRLSLPASRRS